MLDRSLDRLILGQQIVQAGHKEDIIMIGGTKGRLYSGATETNTLERLSCMNGKCQWNEMQEKLKVPRQYHVAFVVPDNFCKFFFLQNTTQFSECQQLKINQYF